jgi:Conserved protein/domain typically associated with flavoprotein oxygenases, DIM6/NTAB family
MSFKKIEAKDIAKNPFSLIGEDWMLIAAKKKDGTFNTMTASWGGMGIMWSKPVAAFVIRPQRYTFEFVEEAEYVTLSFLKDTAANKDALNLCGTKSGRDMDKIKESGLTPVFGENGTVCFEESKLVLVCRKMYADSLNKDAFIDKSALKNYPLDDFHKVYVCEITEALLAE